MSVTTVQRSKSLFSPFRYFICINHGQTGKGKVFFGNAQVIIALKGIVQCFVKMCL